VDRVRRRSALAFAVLAALLLLLGITAEVSASSGGDGPSSPDTAYQLSWWTVDGGGRTVGQPDAGVLAGPGYRLTGGFWGGAAAMHHVYLPLVLRDA